MTRFKTVAAAAALVLTLATPAFAMSGKQMYVGGLAGANLPTASGATTQFTWGGEFGYTLDPTMAIGVNFSTISVGLVSNSFLTAFGDYYFNPNFHAGLGLGLVLASAGPISTSQFAVGPRVGYDFNVGDALTIGPEANVMFSTAAGWSAPINAYAAIKYHF